MSPADLFAPPPQLVRLDRNCDRVAPCCHNVAFVRPRPDTPHAAELRCWDCNRHRGWLPKEAMSFLTEVAKRFGTPTEPITLRDSSIGDHEMLKQQRENSGILFKNNRKETENHPDYAGTINVGGTEFYISAWIKQGPKAKFMSLSVKPKDAERLRQPPEMDDAIPF